jgi:hypothetical protein
LLEICWEKGHGWKELCAFLGKDIPKIALPHENKSSSIKSRFKAIYAKLKNIKTSNRLYKPFKDE